MAALPKDLESSIASIMRELGISVLTMSDLRKRLDAKYSMDFQPHMDVVRSTVNALLQTAEFKRELAKADKQKKEGLVAAGKGKKRSKTSTSPARDDKSKKAKKEKAEKKPEDYPKPALSAYLMFSNENRDAVKEANPSFSIGEVAKKLGEMWNTASDAEKAKFADRAAKDKQRFEVDMAAYIKKGGKVFKRSSSKAEKKGKGKAKDPSAPKRALSAYMYFTADFRKKNPGLSVSEMGKASGAAWKALSDDQKKPFEALAEADKQRYNTEKSGKSSSRAAPSASAGHDEPSSSDSSSSDSSDDSDASDE